MFPTDRSGGFKRLAPLCFLLHRPQRPRGSAYAGLRRQGRANRPLSSRMPMRRMLIAVFGAAIGADPRARGAGTRRRHLVGLLAAARARLRRYRAGEAWARTIASDHRDLTVAERRQQQSKGKCKPGVGPRGNRSGGLPCMQPPPAADPELSAGPPGEDT